MKNFYKLFFILFILIPFSLVFSQNNWDVAYISFEVKPSFPNATDMDVFEEDVIKKIKENSILMDLINQNNISLENNALMFYVSQTGIIENIVFLCKSPDLIISDAVKKEIYNSIKNFPQLTPASFKGKNEKCITFIDLSKLNTNYETTIDDEEIVVAEVEDAADAEPEIFNVVEEMPRFKGCDSVPNNEVQPCTNQAIYKYVDENKVYPPKAIENDIQGKVFVSFVVDETGNVTNIEIKKGVDALLDEAAINVVKSLPKFIPGKQRGKPVKVNFVIPVNFKLP
ncbi:MAG: energy transducer TonB [Chitinophagales bacterium]|nr:energy transducer TonB [Chitinophagales bacterium]